MPKETTIWYFTGTGQCKIVSEYIAANLRSDGHQVKIINITPLDVRNCIKGNIDCNQLIIVFPVYGSDAPKSLKDFMKELKADMVPVMLIALWGNAHKGKALCNVGEILNGNGFVVNGAAEIVAEHSYLGQKPPIIGERPTEAEKQGLVEFVNKQLLKKDSIKLVANNDKLHIKIICSLPQGFVSKLFIKLNLQHNKCNECGICRKMCPVGSIKEDLTVDKKKCIMCLSCVTNCKRKARTCKVMDVAKKALGHHQKIKNENVFYK